MSEEPKMLTREEWIQKIRSEGKDLTIRAEMIRLGFWEEKNLSDEEKHQQRIEDEEYKQLKQELHELQTESRKMGDLDYLLKLARTKRIQESQQKRAERKARRELEQAEAEARWKEYKATHVVHAGAGVSAGLQSWENDEQKLQDNQLPILSSAIQLAEEMGISLSKLKWLTYHRATATLNHYARFTIPKKGGGEREISAPKSELRHVQAWVKEHILDPLVIHTAAYGFVTGRSTVDNARHHLQQAAVIKMDLQDFFPSITFHRVKGLFHSFGYSKGIATLFALICTEVPRKEVKFDGKHYHVAIGARQLPQGACTSPAITNLLCRRLDDKCTRLAEKNGFTYTRYADDLTFSCSQESLSQIGKVMNATRQMVQFEGFAVNEKKTRVLRSHRRQRVTGIVVNEKVNISRKDLKSFRALLHNVEKNGLDAENHRQHPNFWAYIHGYTSYVAMVRPEVGVKFADQVIRIAEKYGLVATVKTVEV